MLLKHISLQTKSLPNQIMLLRAIIDWDIPDQYCCKDLSNIYMGIIEKLDDIST